MKGIWNRLRLALLGGILAFAGAGIVSPLAGGSLRKPPLRIGSGRPLNRFLP